MKKFLPLILVSALLLCSFTTFRQETGEGGGGVTSARTPTDIERGGTVWTRSFPSAQGRYSYNSDPILCDAAVYIANDRTLYELDKRDGTIQRTLPLTARTDSVCHMLLEGDRLMIPLSGGRIECVDIRTMTSLWQSRSLGGQSLSTLFYLDGYLYAGTVNMISGTDSTGIFYCIDTRNGSIQWTYEDQEHPGGYYWSGAVSHKNILYFAGDNGILVSHSLTTDQVYDTAALTGGTKIRSGLTFHPDTDSLYTADTDGVVYRIPLSGSEHSLPGKIQKEEIRSGSAVPGAAFLHCTSTPSVWNGRLYVGSIADGFGHLSVLDAETLSLIYTVQGERSAEIKSSPLVSTGYSSSANHDRVYVYVSANSIPGGVYYLMDDSTCTAGGLQTLYTPASARQFCMSSITADIDGTLYYSNDSNTLFAVSEVENSSDRVDPSLPEPTAPATVPNGTPSPAVPSPSQESKKSAEQTRKPKKPTRLRTARKKKKLRISWKKQKRTQTILYIRYSKRGKWQKRMIRSKASYTLSVKKKKTLYLRLRSRSRSGSKWIYSRYTKTYKIKGSS